MITLATIKKMVEDEYNKTSTDKVFDIAVKSRKQPLPDLRFTFYKLCKHFSKELNHPSLFLIGKEVNRNHASVVHGLKKFENLHNKSNFYGNKVYNKCLLKITNDIDDYVDDEGLTLLEIKDIYRVNHIKMSNKYREVIDSLIMKIRNYRKNDLVDKIASLNDEDLKELEIKLNAFFKVKNSFNKVY